MQCEIGAREMLAVDSRPQELWTGEDVQGTSLVSSASGQSRSDLESFAPETIARKITSTASSVSNGNNGVFKIPGVLRIGEAASMGYGQATLPAEKAFSLQIGWRLFRLSGASIMSDGKHNVSEQTADFATLTSLERPHTSLYILRNS